jgi:hypothetical protein
LHSRKLADPEKLITLSSFVERSMTARTVDDEESHTELPCPICPGYLVLIKIETASWGPRISAQRRLFQCAQCGLNQTHWIEIPSTPQQNPRSNLPSSAMLAETQLCNRAALPLRGRSWCKTTYDCFTVRLNNITVYQLISVTCILVGTFEGP